MAVSGGVAGIAEGRCVSCPGALALPAHTWHTGYSHLAVSGFKLKGQTQNPDSLWA